MGGGGPVPSGAKGSVLLSCLRGNPKDLKQGSSRAGCSHELPFHTLDVMCSAETSSAFSNIFIRMRENREQKAERRPERSDREGNDG